MRLEFVGKIFYCAGEFARKAKSDYYDHALDLVSKNWVMRTPLEAQSRIYKFRAPASSDQVTIVPVLSSDVWLLEPGSQGKVLTEPPGIGGVYGQYYPSAHAIHLPASWQLCDWVWGASFLHECVHALDAVTHGLDYDRDRSESHVRRIESEVLRRLFPADPQLLGDEAVSEDALTSRFGPALSVENLHFYRTIALDLHRTKSRGPHYPPDRSPIELGKRDPA